MLGKHLEENENKERAYSNEIVVFWTWLIMVMVRPLLPDYHAYKSTWIPLSWWAAKGTPLLYYFGAFIWVSLIWILVSLIIIIR